MGIETTIGLAVIPAAVRNVMGWLENALEDKKISNYEWGMLGATIFRVGLMTLAVYYGFDQSAVASASIGVLLDFILSALRRYA